MTTAIHVEITVKGLDAFAAAVTALAAALERTAPGAGRPAAPFPFELPELNEDPDGGPAAGAAPAPVPAESVYAERDVPRITPEDQPDCGAEVEGSDRVQAAKAEQAAAPAPAAPASAAKAEPGAPLKIAQVATEILSEYGYTRPYNAEAKEILRRTRVHFGYDSFGAITADQTEEAASIIRKLAEGYRHA